MNKKALLIIALLTLLVIVGAAAWFGFAPSNKDAELGQNDETLSFQSEQLGYSFEYPANPAPQITDSYGVLTLSWSYPVEPNKTQGVSFSVQNTRMPNLVAKCMRPNEDRLSADQVIENKGLVTINGVSYWSEYGTVGLTDGDFYRYSTLRDGTCYRLVISFSKNMKYLEQVTPEEKRVADAAAAEILPVMEKIVQSFKFTAASAVQNETQSPAPATVAPETAWPSPADLNEAVGSFEGAE